MECDSPQNENRPFRFQLITNKADYTVAPKWRPKCPPMRTMSDRQGDIDIDGLYADFMHVGYNAYQFVMDFGQSVTSAAERTHTRIITSPAQAKHFLEVLRSSVDGHRQKYETTAAETPDE